MYWLTKVQASFEDSVRKLPVASHSQVVRQHCFRFYDMIFHWHLNRLPGSEHEDVWHVALEDVDSHPVLKNFGFKQQTFLFGARILLLFQWWPMTVLISGYTQRISNGWRRITFARYWSQCETPHSTVWNCMRHWRRWWTRPVGVLNTCWFAKHVHHFSSSMSKCCLLLQGFNYKMPLPIMDEWYVATAYLDGSCHEYFHCRALPECVRWFLILLELLQDDFSVQ